MVAIILLLQSMSPRLTIKLYKTYIAPALVKEIKAPSTRIRIRLYPQTFCCGFKTLRVHTYSDSLRFRASTRIRENDRNTQDLLQSMRHHIWWVKRLDSFQNSPSAPQGTSPPSIYSFRSNPKVSTSCLARFVKTLTATFLAIGIERSRTKVSRILS